MNSNASLTKAALLIKNSILSFAGRIIPLFVGLVAIPILIDMLGVTRFGILTLAWVFIGYANIFDFGISRAGVKFISDCIGENNESDIPLIFWTLTIVLFSIGIIIAIILYLISSDLVPFIVEANDALNIEVLYVIRIVGITLPIVLLISGINAYLTAYQSFKWISSIQVFNGILNYALPVLVLFLYDGLIPVMITLFIIKAFVLGLYIFSIRKLQFNSVSFPTFSFRYMKELVKFGGWVSVSNVLSPLVDYIDRFYIAFIMGASVVAYFTTPMDVLFKLGIIPVSIAAVLFPVVSNLSNTDKGKAISFTVTGTNLTLIILFPVAMVLQLFTSELLELWVGPEFALNSTLVAQILLIGIFLKSFTNYSITYLHGIGKPKQTAVVHIAQSILYVIVLYYAVKEFELLGAAIIHTLRLLADYYLMNILVYRDLDKWKQNCRKSIFGITVSALILAGMIFIDELSVKLLLSFILIPFSIYISWHLLIDGKVKQTLLNQIPDRLSRD